MKKILLLLTAFIISSTFIYAQHLFSVSYNELSNGNATQLKFQISNFKSQTSNLSLTKNNENKDVYQIALSSVQNAQIIILNEQTGKHVVLTPEEESLAEFQLSPFFIEELKRSVLGDADSYLVAETNLFFSVNQLASVPTSTDGVFIPRYFYGKKENVKEALPQNRQIITISKAKPILIPAFPDDTENLRYVAQLEEEMSYYVYMFQLPDGTLCTYDEHFNPVVTDNGTRIGENLEFILTDINMNENQRQATLHALSLWGEQLSGSIPVDIEVKLSPLGSGVIGQSWRMPMFLNTTTNTYYPSPLWNQLEGYDATNQRDIRLEMNSQFNFYYGITGNPSYGQIDWITTMLHEVCHGLGFFPLCGQNGAWGNYSYPGIFDRQLFQGTSGVCITELTQAERQALMTSGNLYAGAPDSHLLAANENSRVKIYAPNPYQSGSSNSHWDSYQSFPTFMKYYIDYGFKLHTFNTRKIGILLDLGWTQPVSYPNGVWVTFEPNSGEGNMAKQQFISGEEQNLHANNFKKEGYIFNNWNTDANGAGTSYTDKQSITIADDITLFAQWQANTYTLTFNPNNGTVNPTSKTVIYGEPVGELPIPERSGYTFVNWRIGATIITEETIWNYTSNMTITAYWKLINTYTITATASEGGTIEPAGVHSVVEGENLMFLITPDEEYEILDVLVDNVSVGTENEYIFSNVTASHTIHALFLFNGIGINEDEMNSVIQIVPNPTTGELRIKISDMRYEICDIAIYDVFGRKQKAEGRRQKAEGKILMNISHLPTGVYFIKINTDAGEIIKKVVKQ
jgi:uncharacterized repeat protein (TIGR02543 family)